MSLRRTLGICLVLGVLPAALVRHGAVSPAYAAGRVRDGRFLFEQEMFGGNGRTCRTCHSLETGTIAPADAQRLFAVDPHDPLFKHDGSDDGRGHGAQRMLAEATILVNIPLPPNVSLADDPLARSVTLRRGIPSTLNTPALDPVLMLDGREPSLVSQARNAIDGHAQAAAPVSDSDLEAISRFELSDVFFSSAAVREFARGGPAPMLPAGTTDSEKRGRVFFEDGTDPQNPKAGSCALCHSGPMLDRTNRFFPLGAGVRFISIAVSELNQAGNPVRPFLFRNPNGSETRLLSPDPGRALITGKLQDANAFKISPLRGVRRTAPYFHDNSARTLEEVAAHYARVFLLLDPRNPIVLTVQDQADIVAYLKLLE